MPVHTPHPNDRPDRIWVESSIPGEMMYVCRKCGTSSVEGEDCDVCEAYPDHPHDCPSCTAKNKEDEREIH